MPKDQCNALNDPKDSPSKTAAIETLKSEWHKLSPDDEGRKVISKILLKLNKTNRNVQSASAQRGVVN